MTSTAKSVSPLRTVLSLVAFHPQGLGYFVMTNISSKSMKPKFGVFRFENGKPEGQTLIREADVINGSIYLSGKKLLTKNNKKKRSQKQRRSK